MRKIAIIVIFALLFNVAGCLIAPTPIDPEPQKLFDFPDWITTPKLIETYLRSVNAEYNSDKILTGYNGYYFTPAELPMKCIPDAKNKGSIIVKPEWEGDCDDWALMTAYLAKEALGYEAYYVHIYPKKDIGTPGHALSYAYGPDGKVYVWNLWYYFGSHNSFDEFMRKYYPDMKVTLEVPVWDRINYLVERGHVLYYTDEYCLKKNKNSKNKKESSSCSEGVCPVNNYLIWGVNYFKY